MTTLLISDRPLVATALPKCPTGIQGSTNSPGWGQTGDRRRTREAGFDDHLVKPLEPAVLDAVLARHRAPGD